MTRETVWPPSEISSSSFCVFEKRFFLETHKHWSLFSSYLCFFGAQKHHLWENAREMCTTLFLSLFTALFILYARRVLMRRARKSRSLGERPEQCRARVYNALRIHTRRRKAFLKRERESHASDVSLFFFFFFFFGCSPVKVDFSPASPKKETQKEEQKKKKKKKKKATHQKRTHR